MVYGSICATGETTGKRRFWSSWLGLSDVGRFFVLE